MAASEPLDHAVSRPSRDVVEHRYHRSLTGARGAVSGGVGSERLPRDEDVLVGRGIMDFLELVLRRREFGRQSPGYVGVVDVNGLQGVLGLVNRRSPRWLPLTEPLFRSPLSLRYRSE